MKSIKEEIETAISSLGMIQDEKELTLYLEFLDRIKPHNVMEIGTDKGGSFSLLMKHSTGIKITLDLPYSEFGGFAMSYDVKKRNQIFRDQEPNVFIVEGNSHLDESKQKIKNILGDELLDLLFIDADHSYEGVLQDYMMYYEFVKPGGYIGFHDIKSSTYHHVQNCYVDWLWSRLKIPEKLEFLNTDIDHYGIGIVQKSNTLVLTAYTTNIPWNDYGKNDYAETAIEVNRKYAYLHGYDFRAIEYPEPMEGFSPTWIKIKAILEALNTTSYEYICWVDADAIFVTEDSLDVMKGKDICLTKSLVFENRTFTITSTGLMLIKNTEVSRMVMESLLYQSKEWRNGDFRMQYWHEQGLLDEMFIRPQIIQTYRFDQDYYSLLNQTSVDLEQAFETPNFKILPYAYQSEKKETANFVFHAAAGTPTKNTRLKECIAYHNKPEVEDNPMKVIITYLNGPKVEILGKPNRGNYKVDFVDRDTKQVHHSENIANNMWVSCKIEYFKNWEITVYDREAKKLIELNRFDPTGRRIYIRFESPAVGDTVAWIPYVEEFRKKWNCTVICATPFNFLFEKVYTKIQFIGLGNQVQNIYAKYDIGWFFDGFKNPVDVRTIPLQKGAADILGLEYREIRPELEINTKIQ